MTTTTTDTAARVLITSHGGDFFGEDRHAARLLTSLAGYAEGTLPHTEREHLVQLLRAAGEAPAGTTHTVPADQAAEFAPLLRRVARHRFVKSKVHAAAVALLADAADRAAADGEPWQWRIELGTAA